MNDIKFFSGSNYLYLPTKNNPKVALAVDNTPVAKNAFKLYNPFSKKAQILKNIASGLYINCNSIVSKLSTNTTKSEFIKYLEHKLNKTLTVSIYYATEKDKVVLQLQAENEIYGYLKFPLNEKGTTRLLNEKKAIDILSKQNIVAPILLFDHYKNNPFILLKEVTGEIQTISKEKIDILLSVFKKASKFKLKQHPRVLQLVEKSTTLGLSNCTEMIHTLCNSSQYDYHEVYEHGDFTPWNLITENTNVIPFDFEYFEEYGLEYFDIIKYYYQVGRLINQLPKVELVDTIFKNIRIPEISIIFQLFLYKEIVGLKANNKSFIFEKELLDYIQHGKV